jgi:hypothetical protein
MTSAANTSPEKKREGGATPPSPTPSPVRTILVGLGAAGLVLALIIGLGRIGSGDHIATPTLEEIDPGMLAFERDMQRLHEPPRVYRRVVCSMTMRPYRVSSGLHRTPPLLLRAGCSRWGREGGGCYTNRPI